MSEFWREVSSERFDARVATPVGDVRLVLVTDSARWKKGTWLLEVGGVVKMDMELTGCKDAEEAKMRGLRKVNNYLSEFCGELTREMIRMKEVGGV